MPGKNWRQLGGHPLVAYSIMAARQARTLSRSILSTDSPKIAAIGRRYGAEVPFLRPPELATDEAPIAPVLAHAVSWVEKDQGRPVDIIVLLQATSPFREAKHIDAGVRLLLRSGAESVVGICEAPHSPYWMRVIRDERVESLLLGGPAPREKRRQDLPKAYLINGAFYASKRRVVMERGEVLGKDVRGLIMTQETSIDIDSPLDFMLAETVMRSQRKLSQRRNLEGRATKHV